MLSFQAAKSAGLFQRRLLITGLLLLLALLIPPPALAQTLLNKTTTDSGSQAEQPGKTIEEAIARLQQSLADARQRLRNARKAPESAGPAEFGASADEMQKQLGLLYERADTYEKHIGTYNTLKETREATADLTAEVESWKGFEQAPPYPIALVDELRDAIQAEELRIRNEEVKQSSAQHDLDEAREQLKSTEQRLRKVKEDMEDSDAAGQIHLRWQYNFSLLENEVAKTKALAAETQRLALGEVLAYHRQNLTFLERKFRVASANAPFTKEELDNKLKAVAEARNATQKELRNAIRENLLARERLEEARQALQALEDTGGEQDFYESDPEELARLQQTIDMQKAWVDTMGEVVEGLKLAVDEFGTEELVWEKRFRLARVRDRSEFDKSLEEIDRRLEKLRGHQSYFESNQELTKSLVFNQQNRLSEWGPESGDKELARQTLVAYARRAVFYGHALARIDALIRLLENAREEITERRRRMPLGERLRATFADASKRAMNVWDYELFAAEDTIIVDGQPITARRPVTVSKVVRALLILAMGLWLSSVLARLVRRVSAKYFKLEHNVAGLIEKAFRIAVIVSVVVFALVSVKIPLTIFAFLGGALAIGVGFGAQNLINNLTSGIILLFERPIKVGDIVEVDGTRGRVVNIGARCSEVRCFDGIDILVPNSSFLEKNVINWTLSDRLLRLSISLGVAYGSPTREVSRLIAEAVGGHERVLKAPAPIILFEDFGDNALIFSVFFWIEISSQMDYRIVASDLRHVLDEKLREAGITIAFPQRDVHIDHPRPIQVQILDALQEDGPEKTSD